MNLITQQVGSICHQLTNLSVVSELSASVAEYPLPAGLPGLVEAEDDSSHYSGGRHDQIFLQISVNTEVLRAGPFPPPPVTHHEVRHRQGEGEEGGE